MGSRWKYENDYTVGWLPRMHTRVLFYACLDNLFPPSLIAVLVLGESAPSPWLVR